MRQSGTAFAPDRYTRCFRGLLHRRITGIVDATGDCRDPLGWHGHPFVRLTGMPLAAKDLISGTKSTDRTTMGPRNLHRCSRLTTEDGVVLDWLLKLFVVGTIITVILFDAAAVAVNSIALSGTADEAAAQVSGEIARGSLMSTDAQAVKALAVEIARSSGARVSRAKITFNGILRIRLRRRATTLVLGRIGPLEHLAVATATTRTGTT